MHTRLRQTFGWIGLGVMLSLAPTNALEAKPSNKQLTIGMPQEFETLNPLVFDMAASTFLYYLVGHPMNAYDADWVYRGYLCPEVPTLENGQAKIFYENDKKKMRVTFRIHKKATWGDGTPVTGKDVRFSWQVGLSDNVRTPQKDKYTVIEAVEINEEDPKEFTLKLKDVRYDYNRMGTWYIVPEHIEAAIWQKTKDQPGAYEKQTTYTRQPSNPGLYFGPYIVKELKIGSHVVFERNPHYYGDKPQIERVIVKLIPNTQTLEANLLSGTIDMVSELGMTFDQALSFQKRMGKNDKTKGRFQVLFREGPIYEHIDFNLTNPLLQDHRLRRALVHGVNRQTLVDALFEGKQRVALHNIHPLDPNYSDDVTKYDYDPEKAGKLLEESGWKVGKDGYRYKDGEKLRLSLVTTADNKARELVQVFLQNEWKKIGVDLSLKTEPARVLFGNTIFKMKYPHLAMYAWMASPDNAPLTTTHSKEIPTKANGYSGQNTTAWKNARNDAALNKLQLELDPKKRKELYKVIQQEYSHDLPVIPLYLRSFNSVVPANLEGYRITGHQFYSTLNADQWKLK